MKTTNYIYLPLACLMALVSGCALNRPNITLEPVGPAPFISKTTPSMEGWLVVYSAWDIGSPGDQSDVAVNHHSDYRILSADGKPVKQVNNFVGTFIEAPVTVSLLPGHYTVVAQATALGTATVPINIEKGKTTDVHLDGSPLLIQGQSSDADFVRLPGGSIVGWRANETPEAK